MSALSISPSDAAQGTGSSTATVISPITVLATTALSFDAFVANAGGTVAVDPAGERSSTGAVVLTTAGGTSTAAIFDVAGDAGASYAITLPEDGTTTLDDGLGNSMAVDGFTSDPAGTGTLTGGVQAVSVGAVLTVSDGQPPGAYSGSFTIAVEYN